MITQEIIKCAACRDRVRMLRMWVCKKCFIMRKPNHPKNECIDCGNKIDHRLDSMLCKNCIEKN
jgi:hypothetical protein